MTSKRVSEEIAPGSYDEVVRLLAILARRGATQQALIYELNDIGFEPKRIAQLVGTTRNTVSVILYQRNRKSARKLELGRQSSPKTKTSTGEQQA